MRRRKKKSNYTAKDIKVLLDLEGVRKRPAMYIGDTGPKGLHHLIKEIVDNSCDEVLAGYANEIVVTFHKDGTVSIKDNGRGIPIDLHPQLKKPAVEVVFTKLHAGGKFSNKIYQISGGLHGVGASVVNALSEWLEVAVLRDGKEYYMKFKYGKPVIKLVKHRSPKFLTKQRSGTYVRFKPDIEIFKGKTFDPKVIKKFLAELSYLVPAKIVFINEQAKRKKKTIFNNENGLLDYIRDLNKDKQILHEPFYIKYTGENIEVEIALQYTNTYNEAVFTYVNTVYTSEGGTHLTGFKYGLLKTLNDVLKEVKKTEKLKLTQDDIKEGLNAIIHVKIPEPEFEGQTKMKLGNDEVRKVVADIMRNYFYDFLLKNEETAKAIINKVLLAAKSREAARRAKEITRKSYLKSTLLPTKLADCSSKNRKERELFIVEGESAAGSAKMARNAKTQAILPLKGKIINTIRASKIKMLNNDEIKTLIQAIGAGWGEEFNINKIRYDKIIIMTDADSVTGDTEVILKRDGKLHFTTIKELNSDFHKEDYLFTVRTKNGEFPVGTVIEKNTTKDIYEIITDFNSFKITSSHSVLVYTSHIDVKRGNEITPGDLLLVPKKALTTDVPETITPLTTEMFGNIYFNKLEFSNRILNTILNLKRESKISFLKGIFDAKGSISVNKRQSKLTCRWLVKALDLAKVIQYILYEFSVLTYIRKIKGWYHIIADNKTLLNAPFIWKEYRHADRIKIYSDFLRNDFIETSSFYLIPVRGVNKVKKESLVYDISVVGEDNTFTVTTLPTVVHNSDGNHISVLLLSFFYKYMRPLIEEGKVYIALSPLYKVVKGKKVYFFYSDEELNRFMKNKSTANYIIQRFKGLGEMNPETLNKVVMNPKTRKLKRVTINDVKKADKIIKILMGSNVEKRRQFIVKYAKYANLDL